MNTNNPSLSKAQMNDRMQQASRNQSMGVETGLPEQVGEAQGSSPSEVELRRDGQAETDRPTHSERLSEVTMVGNSQPKAYADVGEKRDHPKVAPHGGLTPNSATLTTTQVSTHVSARLGYSQDMVEERA